MEKFLNYRLLEGDLTRFEALAVGAFDHLNCQHTREFDKKFSKMSNTRESAPGDEGGGGGHRRYIIVHNGT